jgi:ribosomal protein S12 methylthiotransferase
MKEDSRERPVRVGMISLGCAKNLVDAEVMVGTLLKDGVEITNDTAQADVVIVNTCSFIESAQQESVDTILESAELREAKNRGQGLIVSGCLPQRFREQLPKLSAGGGRLHGHRSGRASHGHSQTSTGAAD